jgi:hypothetical protein
MSSRVYASLKGRAAVTPALQGSPSRCQLPSLSDRLKPAASRSRRAQAEKAKMDRDGYIKSIRGHTRGSKP